jgi:predicted SAM-dependent methyltransferase
MLEMALDFSRTKLSFGRSLTSYSKVQNIIGQVIRNKKLFANVKTEGCYLDLGCGPNIDPSFCNLDYSWRPGIDVCWDVTRGLPFKNEYVGGIFTEHMIEHFEFEDALALFKECRRVLKPTRTLRIIVPDGEIYLSKYAKHLAGEKAIMPYFDHDEEDFPFVTPMISVNRIFRFHGHRFIWDYETMRLALLRGGFTKVNRSAFGTSVDQKLVRDTAARNVESLYLEAS